MRIHLFDDAAVKISLHKGLLFLLWETQYTAALLGTHHFILTLLLGMVSMNVDLRVGRRRHQQLLVSVSTVPSAYLPGVVH